MRLLSRPRPKARRFSPRRETLAADRRARRRPEAPLRRGPARQAPPRSARVGRHGDGTDGGREDYLGPGASRKVEKKGKPLLLVPTTAGTGSEATKVGVYTSAAGRKYTLGSPLLQADAALLCGAFAASMPPALTASTGFDALSHALESLWNKNASPVTIDAATSAAAMVLRALPAAYEASAAAAAGSPTHEHDAAALRMLEAAAAAGIAFSITGTALVHALSFVLSEDWHVPHGVACAFTLEDGYRLQARDPEIAQRLSCVAEAAGIDGADPASALLDAILRLKASMRLPFRFGDLGVEIAAGDIEARFARSFDDPKMANSRPAADPSEIYAMLKAKA
ncbi:iron-containing alcohol dehydrogenase [bacterium]|nr:iron-containing alcohol dehydrogenase [bacterium]